MLSLATRLKTRLRRLPVTIGYFKGPLVASWARKRWVRLRNPHATIEFGPHTYLGPGFSLHMPFGGTFITGPRCEFRRDFRAELMGPESVIEFGAESRCTYGVLIQCGTSIRFGERAIVAQSSMLVDGNHRFRDLGLPILDQGYNFRPIEVGDDAMILSKCTIINGVGERAIVGANTVVIDPVPAHSVVAGVPATVIDYFGPDGSRPESLEDLDSPPASSSASSG